MKKWILEHPYATTSVVFLIVIGFGWNYLYWQEKDLAFVLLLYFIVTLGIRLDDIAKKIGSASEQSLRSSKERQAMIAQLKQIQTSLLALNKTLAGISQNSSGQDGGDP
jgi:hypothetical protein